MKLYHIVLPEVWEDLSGPFYEHASLVEEGFIHCSFAEQVEGVIERYYSGRDEVLLLEIDTARLSSRLVVEPSTGGELYPHIYGPINIDAITGTEKRRTGR